MSDQTQVQTVVEYDRSQRLWLVKNGRTIAFPAGREGWRKAVLLALWHDHRELYQVATDVLDLHRHERRVSFDAFADRLLRAGQLIIAGKVQRTRESTTVTSQSNAEVSYTVTWQGLPLWPTCTCPDFEKGGLFSLYGPVCKHILADLLAYFLGDVPTDFKRQGQPITQSEFEQAAARKWHDKYERAKARQPKEPEASLPPEQANRPAESPNGHIWDPEVKALLDQVTPPTESKPNGTPKTIWEMLVDLIDRQAIALLPGHEHPLWQNGKAKVSLRRRPSDDRLVLIARNGQVTTSKPIAYWGSDLAHISGRQGKWLLTEEARANYDAFVAQAQH